MSEKVLKYIEKEIVAKTSDLTKITGNKMAIVRLANKGLVQNVFRGYYSTSKIDPYFAALIIVSKYFKGAVISGLAAAKFYELTDENIIRFDIDLNKNRHINNLFLNARRVVPKRMLGKTTIRLYNKVISIYDEERTLADLYIKYDESIFYKAIKRYCAKNKVDFDKIKYYDEILSTRVLTAIKQEIAEK